MGDTDHKLGGRCQWYSTGAGILHSGDDQWCNARALYRWALQSARVYQFDGGATERVGHQFFYHQQAAAVGGVHLGWPVLLEGRAVHDLRPSVVASGFRCRLTTDLRVWRF